MKKESSTLQNKFLNKLRKNRVGVTVFLVSGIKLQGVIRSYDNFCLSLQREDTMQLVYKHAISTILPLGPFLLSDSDEDIDSIDR